MNITTLKLGAQIEFNDFGFGKNLPLYGVVVEVDADLGMVSVLEINNDGVAKVWNGERVFRDVQLIDGQFETVDAEPAER